VKVAEQVTDEGAQGQAPLGGRDAGGSVGALVEGDGDILHRATLTQKH
jgi:hypothetical protein